MYNYLFKNKSTIIIFIISLFICLIGSGWYSIYILDEAKNAEAAREMLINNEYITPTFNTILRTDKPPLHYYFMMLGYKLFGINPFGARFFSGVFGALTISFSFYFIKKFSSKILSVIYIMILWSSIFFIQEFHLAVPDPYLIFFISTSLWCFYNFNRTNKKFSLWLMYILFGFGLLTKGPVAIVLPGLICLLFFVSTKKFTIKHILTHKPFIGIFLTLLVALPWYLIVNFKTDGAWTYGFFINHNVNRFSSKMEGHGGIFLITWAYVLLGLMPFSFFIFQAFKNAYKNRVDSLLLFSSIVALVFILFFSFSGTKLPNYTMPCYPFLAFLLSKMLYEFYKIQKKNIYTTTTLVLIVLLSIALPIGGKFALQQESALKAISNIAFWLIPTSILSLLGLLFYFKNHFNKAFISVALGWILINPLLFLIIYPKLTAQSPVEKAKLIIPKHSEIIAYKRFDPAFPINFQQTFNVIQNSSEVSTFINNYPKGYIITNYKNIPSLIKNDNLIMVFEGKALFESHTTRIFKKRF